MCFPKISALLFTIFLWSPFALFHSNQMVNIVNCKKNTALAQRTRTGRKIGFDCTAKCRFFLFALFKFGKYFNNKILLELEWKRSKLHKGMHHCAIYKCFWSLISAKMPSVGPHMQRKRSIFQYSASLSLDFAPNAIRIHSRVEWHTLVNKSINNSISSFQHRYRWDPDSIPTKDNEIIHE